MAAIIGADGRVEKLKREVAFLSRQLEAGYGPGAFAGELTPAQEKQAIRLKEEELDLLASEAPTVELTAEQLAVYYLETDRDDARGRALVGRGGLVACVAVE